MMSVGAGISFLVGGVLFVLGRRRTIIFQTKAH